MQTQAEAATMKAQFQNEQIMSDERTAIQQTLEASHAPQHSQHPKLGSWLGGFSSLSPSNSILKG